MSAIDRVFWSDKSETDITGEERERLITVYIETAMMADEETGDEIEDETQVTLCDPLTRQVFTVTLK